MFKVRHAALAAIAAFVITAGITARSAEAESHLGKIVSIFNTPDGRGCAFFQLQGVTQADPVRPGNAWFAIPKTAEGYNEMVSILLMSRSKGMAMQGVYTDGTLSCGHPTVTGILF